MKSKWPAAKPCSFDIILASGSLPPMLYPVMFEEVNAQRIWSAALQPDGASGLSGTDAIARGDYAPPSKDLYTNFITTWHLSPTRCA